MFSVETTSNLYTLAVKTQWHIVLIEKLGAGESAGVVSFESACNAVSGGARCGSHPEPRVLETLYKCFL